MKSSIILGIGSAALLSTGWGCGSCKNKEAPALPAEPEVTDAGDEAPVRQPGPVAPRNITKDGPRFGYMLVVELEDDMAHLWVEGETKSLRRDILDTSFSASGFEWPEGEMVKVLGAGGGSYIRMGEPNQAARPLTKLLNSPGEQPNGFEVQSSVTRNGMSQTFLRIGANQKLKLGPIASSGHLTENWMTGAPPPGSSSRPLDVTEIWPREEGIPQALLPEAAEEIHSAATAEDEALWLQEVGLIRGGEVQIQQSLVADIDRDGENEGAICVTGGRGDYTCYMVDTVGTERRYYGMFIGRNGDAPLMAFSLDGGSYLGWVGRLNRSTAESDSPQIHLIRFDGGGYPTNFYK